MIYRSRRAAALQQNIRFRHRRRRGVTRGEAEVFDLLSSLCIDIRHGDHIGSTCARNQRANCADGSTAGDHNSGAERHVGFLACPNPDRERLHECSCIEGHVRRHRMHERSWQNHVLAKSAVDRWRREELNIRAKVVTTRSALMARATWHTRFHCDRRALSKILHAITEALHDTGGFVTEHQRRRRDAV